MIACKWCGEEGHEPAEVTLGCCGSTVERCGETAEQDAAQSVCSDCDEAHDARMAQAAEDDRRDSPWGRW